MEKGVIKKFDSDKGFGFIKVSGGTDVFFHISALRNRNTKLEEGQEVNFNIVRGSRGPQASELSVVSSGGIKEKVKKPSEFYNPYNFVRWSPLAKEGTPFEYRNFDSHLTTKGNSGKMVCKLVTCTPLIINGSKASNTTVAHQIYEFYKKNGHYTIPGSSIRGMLRSLYEAVTNSSLSILNEYDQNTPLFYRGDMNMPAGLIPGRVTKVENEYKVELLRGHEDKASNTMSAAWVLRHTHKWTPNTSTEYGKRTIPTVKAISHRDEAYAILSKPISHKSRPFKFRNVEEIAKDPNLLSKPEEAIKGYYYESGFNFTRKHDERFFYHYSQKETAPETLPLEERQIIRYNQLLLNYREVNEDKSPSGRVTKSRHILEDKKLVENDLLYVNLDDQNNICGLYPVMISRKQYETSIMDLLPEHLISPKSDEQLCPASRLFGWVNPHNNLEENDINAYKSKITISDGDLNKEKFKGTFEVTLDTLGSPKPTAVPMYLKSSETKAGSAKGKYFVKGYDHDEVTLRGRKMYLSHSNFIRTPRKVEKSKFNRTMKDALNEGNEFQFEILFQDLSDVELGSLLWTVELEKEMQHRLGYAKPYGYGQVKIQVESVELDSLDSYKSWSSYSKEVIQEREHYVRLFKEGMQESFGHTFENINQVKDLIAILTPNAKRQPIHYPKPDIYQNGEHFKWFVKNKKTKGYKQALPYADEVKGLEYF